MKKTILEIYALTVCFFSVACLVVSLGFSCYAVVQIAKPEFTLDGYQYARFESNEAFRKGPEFFRGTDGPETMKLTDEEMTKLRKTTFGQALGTEERMGKQKILNSVITMLIATIAFAIHWRIASGARQTVA